MGKDDTYLLTFVGERGLQTAFLTKDLQDPWSAGEERLVDENYAVSRMGKQAETPLDEFLAFFCGVYQFSPDVPRFTVLVAKKPDVARVQTAVENQTVSVNPEVTPAAPLLIAPPPDVIGQPVPPQVVALGISQTPDAASGDESSEGATQ